MEGCVDRLKNCCHTELPVPACHTSGDTHKEQDNETLGTFLQQIVFTLVSTSRKGGGQEYTKRFSFQLNAERYTPCGGGGGGGRRNTSGQRIVFS